MKHTSPFTPSFDELPNTLPVFPLNNAVVLPGSALPLNIFEPRYLNMVEDAMHSHQLIGMIQPVNNDPIPDLYDVGCAARITRYEETNDGRLEILLSGICRFKIKQELTSLRGYRLITPDWSTYEIDYQKEHISNTEINRSFINVLKQYFNQTQYELDWQVMETLDSGDYFMRFLVL